MTTPIIHLATSKLMAEARDTIMDHQFWTPQLRQRFSAIVAELYAREKVTTLVCGTYRGGYEHERRGEKRCKLCRLRWDVRAARQRSSAERKRLARRSDHQVARDENFADLHEHWQDVLDCESRDVRHVCWSCR